MRKDCPNTTCELCGLRVCVYDFDNYDDGEERKDGKENT